MWLHEIKHDGYRLIVRSVEDRVRLFTRNGFDWTERVPRVLEGAKRLRARSFIIDGEAVICGPDGVAPYRPGRCKSWLKIKNPNSPAMMRVEDRTF